MRPDNKGDVRVGATSSTLLFQKSRSQSKWSPRDTTVFMTCPRSMSLPSVLWRDSLRAFAQWWATPSQTEVGGLSMPGGTKPSLPANPSRIPGKKLASRGI